MLTIVYISGYNCQQILLIKEFIVVNSVRRAAKPKLRKLNAKIGYCRLFSASAVQPIRGSVCFVQANKSKVQALTIHKHTQEPTAKYGSPLVMGNWAYCEKIQERLVSVIFEFI
jgi:hypothetical protein